MSEYDPRGPWWRDPLSFAVARFNITLERLGPALWPVLAIAGVFLALALLEVPQGLANRLGGRFGGWGHAALLAVFVAATLYALRRAAISYRGPDRDAVKRRLEEESGLTHRPLTAFEDGLANEADPIARVVWRTYLSRLRAAGNQLRAGWPRPVFARLDPFGVRAGIGLVLLIGLAVGWQDAGSRLRAAVVPDFSAGAVAHGATLDLWISPPRYTGKPPVLLTRPAALKPVGAAGKDKATPAPATAEAVLAAAPTVTVPIGSEVLARVNGGTAIPHLLLARNEAEPRKVAFERVGAADFQLKQVIDQVSAITIEQGGARLGRWDMTVLPDLPPEISFEEPPAPSSRGALTLSFVAKDDYGVTAARIELRRIGAEEKPTDEPPIVVPLALPRVGQQEVTGKNFSDLTPHPWAGEPVEAVLVASDDLEQTGQSETVRLTLPEREFTHPVARAVIEQRKRLLREPKEHEDIAQIILALAARPLHYRDDIVVFLALKTASTRLYLRGDRSTIEAVQKLLWDTALRIEDGEVSLAARELRDIERRLQEALANNASDAEIERLMQELKEAIDKYLQAMVKEMMQRTDPAQREQMRQQQSQMDPQNSLRRQDMMNMVDRARELARNGARDAARQMLSQLQQMMENLRAGVMQSNPQMSAQQQAMQEMMRQLGDLARRQQGLMDDTFKEQRRQDGQQRSRQGQRQGEDRMGNQQGGRQPGMPRMDGRSGQRGQGQQGQRGDQPGRGQGESGGEMDPDALAQMQEELRRALGEFMRKLGDGMGEIPDGFGKAERSMKEAVESLERGQPGDATGPQADALGHLQQGTQAMIDQLRRQMSQGQGTGDEQSQGMQPGEDLRDPLDRNRPGFGFADRSNVGIPEEADVQRAREIFEELRRRSGDRSRPPLELDYIERLLERF
jgi:uncharacterized protein (TIGR02302 family)